MFGSSARAMHQYQQGKRASAGGKRKTVTTEQFIAAMVADGASREEAEKHARINKAFGTGAGTLIGGWLLEIDDTPKKTAKKRSST